MIENQENVIMENEVKIEGLPLLNTDMIALKNSDEIEIYGSDEQRSKMFKDWSLYFGEVTNPDNTTLNTFFKAKYAPLNEVLNTIRPIMGKYGLSIIQIPFLSNGDPCVKTIVIHSGGGMIAFPAAVGKATKNDIQGFGSTVSYLRRFAVNAIAGVMGEVDDDGNSNAQKPKELKKEELELKGVHEDILKSSTEQIKKGVDKDTVYKIISDNNDGKKNPNSIKDIEIAKKVLSEIKKLKIQKMEETK